MTVLYDGFGEGTSTTSIGMIVLGDEFGEGSFLTTFEMTGCGVMLACPGRREDKLRIPKMGF
jgi:hypothetical protein